LETGYTEDAVPRKFANGKGDILTVCRHVSRNLEFECFIDGDGSFSPESGSLATLKDEDSGCSAYIGLFSQDFFYAAGIMYETEDEFPLWLQKEFDEDEDKAFDKYACQVFVYRIVACDENEDEICEYDCDEDVFTHGKDYVRTRLIACLEDALAERECSKQIRDGSLPVETYKLDALSLIGTN
jgi:hypothetical protein